MQYVPSNLSDIRQTMLHIYSRFEWTQDGFNRLYDSIDTPASCWIRAFENPPLKDDCDGYHAALYWAVSFCFSCRLLTVATRNIKDSHTVMVIHHNNQYRLANYTYLSKPFACIEDVITDLLRTHYNAKKSTRIVAWELSYWNGVRWKSGS